MAKTVASKRQLNKVDENVPVFLMLNLYRLHTQKAKTVKHSCLSYTFNVYAKRLLNFPGQKIP